MGEKKLQNFTLAIEEYFILILDQNFIGNPIQGFTIWVISHKKYEIFVKNFKLNSLRHCSQ